MCKRTGLHVSVYANNKCEYVSHFFPPFLQFLPMYLPSLRVLSVPDMLKDILNISHTPAHAHTHAHTAKRTRSSTRSKRRVP